MTEATSTELLLIACELATRVDCRPERRDGSDAAVYESSGPTLARRVRAGAAFSASCSEAPPYSWTVALQAGAARRTNYVLWLRESPAQLKDLWQAREAARQLRESLPHAQRKKKPWGPL
jgi:hypothetical protein